jgi:hypothetical protein
MGRAVQGVRLMGLSPGEQVVSIARLAERDEVEVGGAPGAPVAGGGEPGGEPGEPGDDSAED